MPELLRDKITNQTRIPSGSETSSGRPTVYNRPIPGLQSSTTDKYTGFTSSGNRLSDRTGSLDKSTNDVLTEIGKQSTDQASILGGLLEAQQLRNEAFEQTLQTQQTQMGELFAQITQSIIDRGTVAETETDRANKAAGALVAGTFDANTGINPNLGQGFSRGRATSTAGLSSAPKAVGSSRRESFQATRPI